MAPLAHATDSARRLRSAFRDHRLPLLWVAAARGLLGIVAVLLVPVLYDEHFVWVVFLRPTKEVLLASGFLFREGDVGLLPAVLAALPFMVGAVWLMYLLGVVYRKELHDADLPGLAGRLLPPERIQRLERSLERDGARAVFLGRLAIFPSTLMAAAAGASDLSPRRFVVADGLGALASMAIALGAGYLLGETYERAGPWLSVLGAVALVALLYVVGRHLRRER